MRRRRTRRSRSGGGYGYNNDRQPYEGERQQQTTATIIQPRGDRPQQNRMDNRPPRPQYDNGQRDNAASAISAPIATTTAATATAA